MSRDELIEWLIMIACILLWWPVVFVRPGSALTALVTSPVYHLVIYVGVPVALIVIFVRRLRRMKAGLEYSKQVVDSQRGGPPGTPDDRRPQ